MGINFNIPALPIEDFEIPEIAADTIKNEVNGAIDYAIVGSGQCGGRIAESFYNTGYKKAITVNTSSQDLSTLTIPDTQKFLFDIGVSGAGKDMIRGEKAAQKYNQQIFDLMRRIFGNCQNILISAGAGGGTGGGSLPTLIAVALRYMEFMQVEDPAKKVGVILTLPTSGELSSGGVKSNAKEILGAVGRMAITRKISPLIIVDNDKIGRLYRGLSVKQFWPTINQTVAGLFSIFDQLANMNSEFTSFDPVDYRSIIQCGGCCIMGLTKVKSLTDETSISDALATNIEKTLLAGGFDLTTAKFAGCIAVGGNNVMERAGVQDMINYGFDTLNNLVGSATCHRGIYNDDRPESANVLKVYTIIGGLDVPKEKIVALGANPHELWPDEG